MPGHSPRQPPPALASPRRPVHTPRETSASTPTPSEIISPAPKETIMSVPLDHLVLLVPHIDDYVDEFARVTGVTPVFGGSHPGRGTKNYLVRLDAEAVSTPGNPSYLELLGLDDAQPDVAPEDTMFGGGTPWTRPAAGPGDLGDAPRRHRGDDGQSSRRRGGCRHRRVVVAQCPRRRPVAVAGRHECVHAHGRAAALPHRLGFNATSLDQPGSGNHRAGRPELRVPGSGHPRTHSHRARDDRSPTDPVRTGSHHHGRHQDPQRAHHAALNRSTNLGGTHP
ncbi:VOC family protein [Acidipropionibacterium jensenii]|nr:VOC family protein [Acidipropionibacterium jensenii]